jgi:hypothetical protein
MAFDGDFSTIWHTRWSTGDDPYPHEISVSLGQPFKLFGFTYYTRQDGENGRIKDYVLYVAMDSVFWGPPVSQGSFSNTSAPQSIDFPDGINAKFFRLVALSEVNGNPWASAAEFSFTGCTDLNYGSSPFPSFGSLKAFPVPGNGLFSIVLPVDEPVQLTVFHASGQLALQEEKSAHQGHCSIDLRAFPAGVYVLRIETKDGRVFRTKLMKD